MGFRYECGVFVVLMCWFRGVVVTVLFALMGLSLAFWCVVALAETRGVGVDII